MISPRILAMLASAAVITLAAHKPLAAQHTLSLDVAVGASGGTGRNVDHTGLSADVSTAFRRPVGSAEWSVGLSGASEGFGPHGDKCRLVNGPGGPCLGPLSFRSVAALLGGGYAAGPIAVSAAAGPAVYVASDGFSAGALQVRTEAAFPAASRAAFVVTARRSWLPNVNGEEYAMTGITVGLRLRARRKP